jgi:hypothetical protein
LSLISISIGVMYLLPKKDEVIHSPILEDTLFTFEDVFNSRFPR